VDYILKEVWTVLTKTERLEIENQVLRESIGRIKNVVGMLGNTFDTMAVVRCLGSIDAAVDFEGYLQGKLEAAEDLKKGKPPAASISRGKSEKQQE